MPPSLTPELYVADLSVSLVFYAAYGFVVRYQRADEGFAYVERDGAAIMLEEPRGRTWLLTPLSSPRGVGMNLQIAVDDVDALFASTPIGATVMLEPENREYRRDHDTLTVRQFVVADPDGYLLRFSQVLAVRPAPPPATP